ncbi:NAD-glutamate dehydrogenase [Vibrio chagasii]|nr:NAD-glutamate dehydrogenase [Vibrio chagasii]
MKEDLVSSDIVRMMKVHAQPVDAILPQPSYRNYSQHAECHPLRAGIIATALANQMVNEMGCNFVTRLRRDGRKRTVILGMLTRHLVRSTESGQST